MHKLRLVVEARYVVRMCNAIEMHNCFSFCTLLPTTCSAAAPALAAELLMHKWTLEPCTHSDLYFCILFLQQEYSQLYTCILFSQSQPQPLLQQQGWRLRLLVSRRWPLCKPPSGKVGLVCDGSNSKPVRAHFMFEQSLCRSVQGSS